MTSTTYGGTYTVDLMDWLEESRCLGLVLYPGSTHYRLWQNPTQCSPGDTLVLKIEILCTVLSVAMALSLSNAMLLIIDDREDQRMILRSVCNHLGIGYHLVGSWEEAEAAIETVSFDLILMDWQMPGVDGIEATKRLRAHDVNKVRYTPIIAVTARAMRGDRETCLEAGMDDYLAKPFTLNELKTKIETWIGGQNDSAPVQFLGQNKSGPAS